MNDAELNALVGQDRGVARINGHAANSNAAMSRTFTY